MTARRSETESDASAALDDATGQSAVDIDPEADDPVDIAATAELLAEENRRLRAEYARAQQAKYRRTAYGLAAIGVIAAAGGVVFPAVRELLFALAATGLFGAVLTRYLSPGQFVSAAVGEQVYTALAANQQAIADELGLTDEQLYVPVDGSARLYRPQRRSTSPPASAESSKTIIVADEHRGLWLHPTGAPLYDAFAQRVAGRPAESPGPLAEQLADALVEQFELATSVTSEINAAEQRVTVAVTGSAFGPCDRSDHPIVSLLATGFAVQLDTTVAVDVTSDEDEWLITCRWDDT